MFETTPYPLLALKILGSLCPCFEKEEDCVARRAAWTVSSIPVRWQRNMRGSSSSNGNSAASKVGGFISGMLGGSNSSDSGSRQHSIGGDSFEPLEGATLSIADGPRGPQLVVTPPGMSMIRKKCVPLKTIKQVVPRKGGIIGRSRSGIKIIDKTDRVVLRFDVLKSTISPSAQAANEEEGWDEENGQAGAVEDVDESTRDDIIDQLEILVDWERRRQAYLLTLGEEHDDETYIDEYDDDDGTSSPRSGARKGVIAEQAQKIKHFAQREIEMSKAKKERENRKAKYIKEAGGLKYTAIAMSQR